MSTDNVHHTAVSTALKAASHGKKEDASVSATLIGRVPALSAVDNILIFLRGARETSCRVALILEIQ